MANGAGNSRCVGGYSACAGASELQLRSTAVSLFSRLDYNIYGTIRQDLM